MKYTFTKALIISCLFLTSVPSIFAQTAILKGNISDQVTGEGLIGATIKCGDQGVISDFEGNYTLEITEGNQTVSVSFIGYEAQEKDVTLKSGETLTLDFQLAESATVLQTATVTSGKYEKPLGEVTVSMEVLKPRLMESINSTSISDALGKIPGLTIINGQANIRGGSGWSYGAGSRVLLLVDDIPALQADAGRPNWSDYPFENTEQVEIIKGAASALYGSSAMNGIINVRTSYAKSEPETKVATFFTSFLDPKDKEKIWYDEQPYQVGLNFSHKQKFNNLDFIASGFAQTTESFREASWSRSGRLATNLRYRIKDNLHIGLNANYNTRKSAGYFYWKDWGPDALRGNSTSSSNTRPSRVYFDPYLNYFDDKGNQHKFLSRLYFIDNNNDNNQSNQSQLYYGEYQYQKRFDEQNLVITGGLVGIHTGIQAEIYGDTTYTTSNMAGYLQVEKKLFDKLNLSAGARYERNTINSPEVVMGDTIPDGRSVEAKPVFRFGMNYQSGQKTFLRASWGQGYRFPTIAEKFVFTDAGAIRVVPNPFLESETGWTAEIGIKQGLRLGNWNGYLDVAAFWSEYNNMMEYTFIEGFSFQSQNIGNTEIKGIDVSIVGEGKISDDLTVYVLGGYTYVDPKFKEFDETGNTLPNTEGATEGQSNAWNSSADYNILKYRNKHSAKMDIEVVYKKLNVGIAGNYLSHMEAIDRIFELFIAGLSEHRAEDTNGWQTFDARIGYQFIKNGKVSIIAKNIFNEEYTVRPALLEAPTNITMRLEFKF